METTGRIKKSTVLNIQTDQDAIKCAPDSYVTVESDVARRPAAVLRNEVPLQFEIQTQRILLSTLMMMAVLIVVDRHDM